MSGKIYTGITKHSVACSLYFIMIKSFLHLKNSLSIFLVRKQGIDYLCSFPITRTPPPPYLGKKDVPPTSGIGFHWQLQKASPFSGFSREIFPRLRTKKYPLFPRKWEYACGPLMYSSRGGGASRDGIVHHTVHSHITNLTHCSGLNFYLSVNYRPMCHYFISLVHDCPLLVSHYCIFALSGPSRDCRCISGYFIWTRVSFAPRKSDSLRFEQWTFTSYVIVNNVSLIVYNLFSQLFIAINHLVCILWYSLYL